MKYVGCIEMFLRPSRLGAQAHEHPPSDNFLEALRSMREGEDRAQPAGAIMNQPICPKCKKQYRNRRVPPRLRKWDVERNCWNYKIPACECRVPKATYDP